jgi:hypothetical protein
VPSGRENGTGSVANLNGAKAAAQLGRSPAVACDNEQQFFIPKV